MELDRVFLVARRSCFINSDHVSSTIDLTGVGLLCSWRSERMDWHSVGFIDGPTVWSMIHMWGSNDTVSLTTDDAIVLTFQSVHEVCRHLVRLGAVTALFLN